jgi:hypothetical protein
MQLLLFAVIVTIIADFSRTATQILADGFNKFLADLEAEGYQPPKEASVRSNHHARRGASGERTRLACW